MAQEDIMDKERGTYSPPTEDHLSYGGARRSRASDQAPLTLIISGIVLVLLLIAVVVFYNASLNAHNRLPGEVGTSVGGFKDGHIPEARPINDGGSGAADVNASGTPHIVDETETPVDRNKIVNEAPTPVAPVDGPIPGNDTSSSVTSDDAFNSSKPTSNPMPQAVADALTPEAPKAMPAPVAKPAPQVKSMTQIAEVAQAQNAVVVKPKPKLAKTEVAQTATKGSFSVQIGAFKSRDIATAQFEKTRSGFTAMAAGTSKHIEAVDTNGVTLYRTAFTGFATRDRAKAFCAALSASGKSCFVK